MPPKHNTEDIPKPPQPANDNEEQIQREALSDEETKSEFGVPGEVHEAIFGEGQKQEVIKDKFGIPDEVRETMLGEEVKKGPSTQPKGDELYVSSKMHEGWQKVGYASEENENDSDKESVTDAGNGATVGQNAVEPYKQSEVASNETQKADDGIVDAEFEEINDEKKALSGRVESAEVVGTPEFFAARAEWKKARAESDAMEEYYQAHLENFYRDNEKGFVSGAKRWLGIQPEFSDELKQMSEQSIAARVAYKKAGAELVLEKYQGNAERGVAVSKRYERMLAQKILVTTIEERNAIQQDVVENALPEKSNFHKGFELLKKTRTARIVGAAALYGGLGFATGGASVALVAGGRKLAGAVMGAKVGAIAGMAVHEAGRGYVSGKEEQYKETQGEVKGNLFDSDFEALEEQIAQSADSIRRAKRNVRVASTAAAVGAGFAAGTSVSSAIEDAADAAAIGSVAPESAAGMDISGVEDVSSTYTVEKGDNLWNMMEGDVEGREMSDALKNIPEEQRNAALTKLFERVDADPSLREAIGMSSAHANAIQVGENINVAALESALQNIAVENGYIDGTLPEGGVEAVTETTSEAGEKPFTFESEEPNSDPLAEEDVNSLPKSPMDGDADVLRFVKEVETQKSGIGSWFSGPNIQGFYENFKLGDKTFDELFKLNSNPEARALALQAAGVREEGWAKWSEALMERNERLPITNGETVGAYLERYAQADIPPQDVE